VSNLVAIAYDDLDQAKEMKKLGDELPVGGAAVFVLVREATRDKVVPEVSKYGGHVMQSSLSNEQEAQLQRALDARAVGAGA
jgi:uncharacterized membrane protein